MMPEKTDIEELKNVVTKLKRDISELSRSNAALAAEKEILDDILGNLPGTFFIWNDQSQLIRRNKKHDVITEYSENDYVNMGPTDFFDEKEHHKVEVAFEELFTHGEVVTEATLVTKSGKKIPHLYSACER